MSAYNVIYKTSTGDIAYVNSAECGGADRYEWKTYVTALKWLKAYKAQTDVCPELFITLDDEVIIPEVTAVSGSSYGNVVLSFYNGHLKMTHKETMEVLQKLTGRTNDLFDFMGLSYDAVMGALEETRAVALVAKPPAEVPEAGQSVVEFIKSLGYSVWQRPSSNPTNHCFYSDVHGNVAYAQWRNGGRCLLDTRVGTVHMANSQCGTGFSLHDSITATNLAQALRCLKPHWDNTPSSYIRKFKGMDAYRAQSDYHAGYVEV